MLNPSGVCRKPRVVDELGQRDHLADGGEDPVVAAGDHQLAVAGGEDLVGRDHWEHGALPARDGAVGEVASEVIADVAERSLVERDVDNRAGAGPLAL